MALDPLTGAFELGGKVLDKLFPDPEKRQEAQLRLVELQQSGELAQISVNQEEARHENLFVAGWRPFVGWVCGIAFCYHLIIQPLIAFFALLYGHDVKYPVFDERLLADTLYGLLGIGSLRTVEKMATKGHLPWQK